MKPSLVLAARAPLARVGCRNAFSDRGFDAGCQSACALHKGDSGHWAYAGFGGAFVDADPKFPCGDGIYQRFAVLAK